MFTAMSNFFSQAFLIQDETIKTETVTATFTAHVTPQRPCFAPGFTPYPQVETCDRTAVCQEACGAVPRFERMDWRSCTRNDVSVLP